MSRAGRAAVQGVALLAALAHLSGCTSAAKAKANLPPEDGVTATGECNTVFGAPVLESGFHVAECSPITYSSNPPCAGHHYAVWADYKEYAQPFPAGYWVHSLEHGGVAFLYGCDAQTDPACQDMLAEVRAYRDGLPADPKCEAPTKNRTLVLPYPELGAAFSAVVWGHYLRAECFDASLVTALIEAYYGENYEDTCAAGFDPTEVPKDCGK